MGAESLVIDASVAIKAALVESGFNVFRSRRLAAPTLMWSEAAAGLRQLEWRGEITAAEAKLALDRIRELAVAPYPSADLVADATTMARQLGWAKTYDAEYLALARRLDTALVTLDARLRRSAPKLIRVLGPTELGTPTPTYESGDDDVVELTGENLSGSGEH